VLLYLTDVADGLLQRIFNKNFDTNTFEYQSNDKILDLYTSTFVVIYLSFLKTIPLNVKYALYMLLLYRTVGVFMFIKSRGKSIFLKIFSDAIREFTIFITLFMDNEYIMGTIEKNILIIVLIFIIFKSVFEIFFHKTDYN
jgi:hypothetical protein